MNGCTYIDGIASSQAIDTAGEIVDIMGLDCSSLIGAAFNYEHKSDVPAQIVGKVLECKKIFSEKDCDTERQRYYWNKVNMPFLYVLGRLFDDKKESSKEIAALFLDDSQNPNEPPMLGFSIEGAKINKEGMTITRSIARKVTITNLPANKSCVAEMIPAQNPSQGGSDDLFRSEVQFFAPDAKYLKLLQKREKTLSKDVGSGGGAFIGSSLAMSEMNKKVSWKHTGGGNFQHPEHGIVSVVKQGPNEFHVKHNGALAGVGGVKGVFGSAGEAGKHAGAYMHGVSAGKILPPRMQGHPSPSMMNKALEAGSAMGAPSTLTQSAALGKENLDRKMKKDGTGDTGGMGTLGLSEKRGKKSTWLLRAEQAYKTWEKREVFETFMKSRMPHLTKGEIKAIGQTLALKKSVKAEKEMSKMFASYFNKGTDILMANEKKKK